MSFFNYGPKDPVTPNQVPPKQQEVPTKKSEPEPKPEPRVDPRLILIDGTGLIKEVTDNPDIPDAKVDIGQGMARQWQPLNYNPSTGVITKWK